MEAMGLGNVLAGVLLALFVLRRLLHAKRRSETQSPEEWVAALTEKVRNPLRYRSSATVRWIVG